MNNERELGWNEVIENDSPDFITLPEGDYDFVVTEFERARHNGSEKLPACNKAVIHIRIEAPEGVTTIKHNLFLHTKTEGMLCAFFTAIGQRKKGERATMNWNAVVGSKGRCKVGIRTWKTDDGREMTSNDIKRFYDPETDKVPGSISQPAAQKTFEAGRF
ncbi:hypothetical protein [Ruminiclostridium cellulolyticum]|uniref:Phage protein n=1 Tax=Ruminiclostridium cellulolyticum (strain ATCC 35319 / DSM 5812 / JCM 6584 / H10) TaxID=394503 RepID=B8I141_RUMCH|nr:hypothetical protein [Ruminiclostridium cellulolyticum]ACL77597.1 phage protein [Ruminiclostridium cellulolyticum H10]